MDHGPFIIQGSKLQNKSYSPSCNHINSLLKNTGAEKRERAARKGVLQLEASRTGREEAAKSSHWPRGQCLGNTGLQIYF